MVKGIGFVLVCLALMLLFGCGKTDGKKEAGGTPLEDTTVSGKIRLPVSDATLLGLLPDALGQMKRTGAGSTPVSTFDAEGQVSAVYATYEGGGGTLSVTIYDYGPVLHADSISVLLGWTKRPIDHKTSGGYQKTTTFSRYPAYEVYDTARKIATLEVFVGGRFVVQGHSVNMDMAAIKSALSRLDLPKLDRMKNQGATK